MIELCELSVRDQYVAEGKELPIASSITEQISLKSMDLCKFEKAVKIGELLTLNSRAVFADPKSGLVYVRIESENAKVQQVNNRIKNEQIQ